MPVSMCCTMHTKWRISSFAHMYKHNSILWYRFIFPLSIEYLLLSGVSWIVHFWSAVAYVALLSIKNNSKVLIGQERWMKSSYPFGSWTNLELWHHDRILKTLIRHYDVICSYIENIYTTLWRHTNLCCLCQMQNTNGLCCLCQNLKYKWLLQG